MLTVIRGRNLFIISSAIVLDDMLKVFPEWADDPQSYAYGYAFFDCLCVCGRIAANPEYFRADQMIKAWHDQCQWNHVALAAFEKIRGDSKYSENWRFAELTYASAESNICLQPADMMAYECWKESERFAYDSVQRPDMRPFFSHLVKVEEHRVYATYADERFFREHRRAMMEK